MKITSVINQNKYAVAVFAMLSMMSVIYDGFSNVTAFALKVLLSLVVSLFFSPFLRDETQQQNYIPVVFSLLSIISCNAVFLTADIHILLSLICFFIALTVNPKLNLLTAVFSGICVALQPLSLFYLVPSIVLVQLVRKQKISAVISSVLSIAVFIVTKLFENTDFYAEQFSSYYHSVHPVFFSKDHLQVLTEYSGCSVIMIAVLLFYCVKIFLNAKKSVGIGLIITTVVSLYGYSMCFNKQNVIMILLPAFAVIAALSADTSCSKAIGDVSEFFLSKKLLLFILIALTLSIPAILGTLPIENDFFSKSTFIIFREE